MRVDAYRGGSAKGEKDAMLVHPEQGARVPVKGPTAKAMGFSGEEIEGGKFCSKKEALRPLPPNHLRRSPSGMSSDHAFRRVRSIQSLFLIHPFVIAAAPYYLHHLPENGLTCRFLPSAAGSILRIEERFLRMPVFYPWR